MGRIIRDPKVMGGKPVVKGTRVTVEVILRRLASGLSVEDLLRNLSYTFSAHSVDRTSRRSWKGGSDRYLRSRC
ncbi:MAG: DUF433 domain-containing protein [Candidatus Korarchaeota archaeon]|nr:DUF433 domain-containing protein [Candidatus Korarchaeota archaeon]